MWHASNYFGVRTLIFRFVSASQHYDPYSKKSQNFSSANYMWWCATMCRIYVFKREFSVVFETICITQFAAKE